MAPTPAKCPARKNVETQTELPQKHVSVRVSNCSECLSRACVPHGARDTARVRCEQINYLLRQVVELKEEVSPFHCSASEEYEETSMTRVEVLRRRGEFYNSGCRGPGCSSATWDFPGCVQGWPIESCCEEGKKKPQQGLPLLPHFCPVANDNLRLMEYFKKDRAIGSGT